MNKYIVFCIIAFLLIDTKTRGQSINLEFFSIGTIIIDKKVNGSAFILTKPNLVVTCAHVLIPGKSYYYRPQGIDSLYQLELIFIDNETDLALLESKNDIVKKPLNCVQEFNIKPGQHLFYMGYNKNISRDEVPVFQVDNAVVTSIGITKIKNSFIDFIEFNGVGMPGYSGGPVFNDEGEVVGLMREAWQKRDVKRGNVELINRAYSIIPIIDKIPID